MQLCHLFPPPYPPALLLGCRGQVLGPTNALNFEQSIYCLKNYAYMRLPAAIRTQMASPSICMFRQVDTYSSCGVEKGTSRAPLGLGEQWGPKDCIPCWHVDGAVELQPTKERTSSLSPTKARCEDGGDGGGHSQFCFSLERGLMGEGKKGWLGKRAWKAATIVIFARHLGAVNSALSPFP